MPFRPLGPDPMPPFLAEGLVDDIVRMLASLREPVVISSNSTRGFRDSDIDPKQIERLFGVRYIVCGTARAVGRTLRLSVELSDTTTGAVLWAQAYDTQDNMVFAAQDHIVEQIVNRVAPRVHEAELRRVRIQRPKDLSAYHLTLEARDMIFGLEEEPFEQAGRLLRQAIALEPGYAAAHGALASWYSLRLGQGWSPDRMGDASALHRYATAALRLDSGNARAMALLGHGKTVFEQRHVEGASLSDHALDVAPNDAEVWLLSCPTRAYMGEARDAVQRGERALRLSPQDPHIFRTYHFLCIAHYANGSYEEAVHFGNLSFHANPRYTSNSRFTAASLVELGRHEEARAFAANAMTYEPGFRATEMLKRLPFQDVSRRERYVRQLLDAGIPA
jgi:TolB-like protein/Tfp pilus assembly protein PilF